MKVNRGMTEPSVFCMRCGRRLVEKWKEVYLYNDITGEPSFVVERRCPKRGKILGYLHTNHEYLVKDGIYYNFYR